MSIWKRKITPEQLNQRARGTLVDNLGIEFVEVGEDFIRARMPVDRRTVQPYGLLHGGASAALAETLGSYGAVLSCEEGKRPVGLEINANHVRAVRSGHVVGTVRPVHRGRSTHVWDTRIEDESGRLVSVSRITLAILGEE